MYRYTQVQERAEDSFLQGPSLCIVIDDGRINCKCNVCIGDWSFFRAPWLNVGMRLEDADGQSRGRSC